MKSYHGNQRLTYLNDGPVFALGTFIQLLLFTITDVEDPTEQTTTEFEFDPLRKNNIANLLEFKGFNKTIHVGYRSVRVRVSILGFIRVLLY